MRLWWARLGRPLRWRSRRRTARMLLDFAVVERSSALDLLAAANGTADLARRALFVRHAVDEARHADLFAARARALDPSLLEPPPVFERLVEQLGEARFLAFVHHGERRGRAQMELYARELAALEGTPRADTETRALFEAIVPDEERHERYTAALLGGASVRGAQVWEWGRAWRRAGEALSQTLFTALAGALYLLLAPLAWLQRGR